MKRLNMRFIWKNIIWISVLCGLFACPVFAADPPVEEFADAKEISEVLQKEWEDGYFQEIVVKEDSNQVEIDGKIETFTNVFDTNLSKMRKAVAGEKELENFLANQEQIYDVEKKEDGVYAVSAPYQTKRIVVACEDVKGSFGEKNRYIYHAGGKTILTFDTEEATKNAYDQLKAIYGEKNCYVDQIVSIDSIAQSFVTDEEESPKPEKPCLSWGVQMMGLNTLKNNPAMKEKAPITVAVVDTGISAGNAIFRGTTISPLSYNFLNGNKDITDYNGHGTHVAGIIADATPDNVQLLVLKIAGANGQSSSLVVSLAMDYAVQKNAQIINLSYGFISKDALNYTFLDAAIDAAYKKGIPVCVAAGNTNFSVSGRNIRYCYPACNEQTIVVSALDQNKNLADYSYYGAGVDFSAPGNNIISAGLNGNYMMMSGTSMATPHITAALVYIKLSNPNLSVLGSILELKKYSSDLGAIGKDAIYGYGLPILNGFYDAGISFSDWTVQRMLLAPKLKNGGNVAKGTKLSWGKVKGASGYEIYRRMSGGKEVKLATLPATAISYIDGSAQEGKVYGYYVKAFAKLAANVKYSGRSNIVNNYTLRLNTITKLKATGRKRVLLQKKKASYWNGKVLQIQYSYSKNFKKRVYTKNYKASLNSITFAAKSKGYIYVRIRTRVLRNKVYLYSAWSTVKKIKVR